MENLNLKFEKFVSEDDIEMGRDILCLVSSRDEPPYFIIMTRKVFGIVIAFGASKLDNSKILKWAYLPEINAETGEFESGRRMEKTEDGKAIFGQSLFDWCKKHGNYGEQIKKSFQDEMVEISKFDNSEKLYSERKHIKGTLSDVTKGADKVVLKFKCSECDEIFYRKPKSLTQRNHPNNTGNFFCPKCTKRRKKSGSIFLNEWMEEYGVERNVEFNLDKIKKYNLPTSDKYTINSNKPYYFICTKHNATFTANIFNVCRPNFKAPCCHEEEKKYKDKSQKPITFFDWLLLFWYYPFTYIYFIPPGAEKAISKGDKEPRKYNGKFVYGSLIDINDESIFIKYMKEKEVLISLNASHKYCNYVTFNNQKWLFDFKCGNYLFTKYPNQITRHFDTSLDRYERDNFFRQPFCTEECKNKKCVRKVDKDNNNLEPYTLTAKEWEQDKPKRKEFFKVYMKNPNNSNLVEQAINDYVDNIKRFTDTTLIILKANGTIKNDENI